MTEPLSFFSKKVEPSKVEPQQSFVSSLEGNFLDRIRALLRNFLGQMRDVGFSPLLGLSIFLVICGISISTYSVFRLQSDSHLVCVSSGELISSIDASTITQETESDADSNNESINDVGESDISSEKSEQKSILVTIDISGAVKKPGLYHLSADTRVGDAIAAAGGLSSQASAVEVAQSMNLASKIKDGQKMYVPFIGEDLSVILRKEQSVASALDNPNGGVVQTSTQNGDDTNSGVTKTDSNPPTDAGGSTKISINSASATQLMELKGIGEKRAADIIAGRPYEKIDDLLVKGILTQSLFTSLENEMTL